MFSLKAEKTSSFTLQPFYIKAALVRTRRRNLRKFLFLDYTEIVGTLISRRNISLEEAVGPSDHTCVGEIKEIEDDNFWKQ